MDIRGKDELREMLSAEYVLGTLSGLARQRFARWMRDDATLRRTVHEWEGRLVPLAELIPAATPPARLWNSIASRLGFSTQQTTSLWSSLNFWRGLGFASTAMAAVLFAVVALRTQVPTTPVDAAPAYVATLADEKSQPVLVLYGDAARSRLIVKVVGNANITPDKSLELWALPKGGAPLSLGLIEGGIIRLPNAALGEPDQVPALAVTLEPKGGSPYKNAPTGPVLYKGAWVRM